MTFAYNPGRKLVKAQQIIWNVSWSWAPLISFEAKLCHQHPDSVSYCLVPPDPPVSTKLKSRSERRAFNKWNHSRENRQGRTEWIHAAGWFLCTGTCCDPVAAFGVYGGVFFIHGNIHLFLLYSRDTWKLHVRSTRDKYDPVWVVRWITHDRLTIYKTACPQYKSTRRQKNAETSSLIVTFDSWYVQDVPCNLTNGSPTFTLFLVLCCCTERQIKEEWKRSSKEDRFLRFNRISVI